MRRVKEQVWSFLLTFRYPIPDGIGFTGLPKLGIVWLTCGRWEDWRISEGWTAIRGVLFID